jgi:hypothetical protein
MSISEFACSEILVSQQENHDGDKYLMALELAANADISALDQGLARSCGFPVLGMLAWECSPAFEMSAKAAKRRKNAAHGASRGWLSARK